MKSMTNWWDHVAPYVPFVLLTDQHPRTSVKSVVEALIIAAVGGAVGTYTAFLVLRTEFGEFRISTEKAIVRIEKVMDKLETTDDRLRGRIVDLEKSQARQEGASSRQNSSR
jgi:hypothetical protein